MKICPNCHDANSCGDYEGPTCDVCGGLGKIPDALPEVVKAIEIADKHLPTASPARRAALAKDIIMAIKDHAEQMAYAAIRTASSATRREH